MAYFKNIRLTVYIFSLFLLAGIWSCANYKLKYDKKHLSWESVHPSEEASLTYSVYLIGDAGYAPKGKSTPLFDHLEKTFNISSQNSTAIWLGDNIYPVGLAPKNHKDHPLGKHRIKAQLKTMVQYPGKVFFIPGNHDWYEYGQEGLSRQEELVESYLTKHKTIQIQNSNEYFIPDDGCGNPVAKKLSENITLIVIDSHWYLKGRYDQHTKKDHCSVKSHQDYLHALDQLFMEHKDDKIILAAHHPPYTYGKHGGHYKPKYYFFPLTQVNNSLIIPLPFSGIIANLGRAYVSEQDTKHVLYGRYREEIISRATSQGQTIIVSGHEHNLQYINKDGISFIISGSGSKKTEVALGEGSQFAIGDYGYTVLNYYDNGQIIAHYYAQLKESFAEVYRVSL